MYYIAYGSNINPIQMANLCNNPVFIGTGLLHDYEMDFYATTKNPKTANVYADVVYNNTSNNSDTPVVVWKIENEKDLGMLDSFEGYPNLYTKIENCRVTLSNGEEITGFCIKCTKIVVEFLHHQINMRIPYCMVIDSSIWTIIICFQEED